MIAVLLKREKESEKERGSRSLPKNGGKNAFVPSHSLFAPLLP